MVEIDEKMAEVDEKFDDLKKKLNKSMAQVVRLILSQKKRMDALEERLATYNLRAGHKI